MNRITERIIALLLLLFLAAYVGYQVYQHLYSPLTVETAFEYAVTHSIPAVGLAVREETVIDIRSTDGGAGAYPDGTRVSAGQAVSELYASGGDQQMQEMRQLEQEIAALTEAQNPAVSNYYNADTINRDIRISLGQLAKMSSTGRFDDMDALGPNLVTLINKKQIAIGKEQSYQSRISQLQARYDQLEASYTVSSGDMATAPHSGYFVKAVDGLESISMGEMEEYALSDYLSLVERANPSISNNRIGKIVSNSYWNFIAVTSKEEVQWLQAGRSVELEFLSVDGRVPATVQQVISEKDSDDAVLLLQINHVNADLLNLRKEQAVIHLEEYSGLRINTSAIRFQTNRAGEEVQGVYVLSRNTVRFKKIDPIYEEAGFVISREYTPEPIVQSAAEDDEDDELPDLVDDEESLEVLDEDDEDALALLNIPEDYATVARYDQIITKGRDLYHGKVIE